MKRFNYKFILILIILFIIPNYVNASSTIILDCPNKGNPNNTITCNLKGSSDKPISSLSAKISTKEDIEFTNFTTNPIWEGNGNNGSIELYTDVNKTSLFEIGTITLKLGSTSNKVGTIIISDITYYDNNFKPININNISKDIKINSTNNYLSNLSIKGHNITPSFNKEITEYSTTIDSNEIIIEATLEDSSATINGLGTKSLKEGANNFFITVTSEAGTKKEYKLIIIKPKEEVKEEKPKEEENNKPETKPESDTKEENKKTDSKLKKLNIKDYKIDFNSSIYKYSITVNNDVEKLEIEAIPTDSKANVTIKGNKDLKTGNNDITITVTTNDNSKSEYIITVIKKSDSCIVNNITISDYDLKFNCNTYNYELEIGFEENLNIDVLTNNKQAKVNIHNNDKLKHNDVIKIIVNLDGIDYKYNIKILKNNFELGELFNEDQLTFIGIVLIITSIYIITRKIIKKKKNKNIKESE